MLKVSVFKNDVTVTWSATADPPDGGNKAEVTEFSERSRKRLAFVANNTGVGFGIMVTLTYPDIETDGKKIKKHLNRFLVWVKRRGVENYLWFLEFQKRGAPHFHVLLDIGYLCKDAVNGQWAKIIEHDGYVRTETAKIRSPRGANRYAVKYAMKMRQKSVPERYRNVGRFWGHSRGVKPEPTGGVMEMGEDEFFELLEGWPYLDRVKSLDYMLSTLYNASAVLTKNLTR